MVVLLFPFTSSTFSCRWLPHVTLWLSTSLKSISRLLSLAFQPPTISGLLAQKRKEQQIHELAGASQCKYCNCFVAACSLMHTSACLLEMPVCQNLLHIAWRSLLTLIPHSCSSESTGVNSSVPLSWIKLTQKILKHYWHNISVDWNKYTVAITSLLWSSHGTWLYKTRGNANHLHWKQRDPTPTRTAGAPCRKRTYRLHLLYDIYPYAAARWGGTSRWCPTTGTVSSPGVCWAPHTSSTLRNGFLCTALCTVLLPFSVPESQEQKISVSIIINFQSTNSLNLKNPFIKKNYSQEKLTNSKAPLQEILQRIWLM